MTALARRDRTTSGPHRARRVCGFLLIAAIAAFGLLGPWLIGIDPAAQDLGDSLSPPRTSQWLGTDALGRSVVARLAVATRLSIGLAWLAAGAACIPGVLLGVAATWRGGIVERSLVLLADAALSIPGLLLVVLFASIAPGAHWALFVGLSLSMWVEYFRVTRAASRPVLDGDAVQAARLLGFGPVHVVRRHLGPALLPLIGTLLAFTSAQAVLSLAALGFVGVGLQPPTAELGLMMTESLPYYQEAPWLIAAPVVVVTTLVLGMVLIGSERRVA